MEDFLVRALGSFCYHWPANVIALVVVSTMGTFGFGDLKKDVWRVAFVALIVGIADGAWVFLPTQHWALHGASGLVHLGVLRLTFLEELTNAEAVGVAVICRVGFFVLLQALA